MGFIVLATQVIQYLSYNKSHIVNLCLFYNSITFERIDILKSIILINQKLSCSSVVESCRIKFVTCQKCQ